MTLRITFYEYKVRSLSLHDTISKFHKANEAVIKVEGDVVPVYGISVVRRRSDLS